MEAFLQSPLFDQSRWQIFLYPVRTLVLPESGASSSWLRTRLTPAVSEQNSGHDQYVSLYLSCEPTQAEKERALSEKPDLSATVQAGGSSDARVGKDSGKDRDRMPWKRDGHFKFSFEVGVASSNRSAESGRKLMSLAQRRHARSTAGLPSSRSKRTNITLRTRRAIGVTRASGNEARRSITTRAHVQP